MRLLLLILSILLTSSCQSQQSEEEGTLLFSMVDEVSLQIGDYVTGAYEDSKGHLWFGTLGKGIARYDGEQLRYFSTKDGLPTNRVTGVIEDAAGIFWFSTGEGLAKFDGEQFTHFPIKDDFFHNMVSQLFIDSKGTFWIGTWGGVYQFDGQNFTAFTLPYPNVSTSINPDTKNWITDIKEDQQGNIWFSRDGYGACKFDGTNLTHYLKKNGLLSNNITEVEIDQEGNVWFGSRVGEKDNPNVGLRNGKGGLNKLTADGLISFPEISAFNTGDVYEVYEDDANNIWIGTTQNGVYKFEDDEFKRYDVPASVMDMCSDQNGNLWLAAAGGLYRINKAGEIINVTINGPWTD